MLLSLAHAELKLVSGVELRSNRKVHLGGNSSYLANLGEIGWSGKKFSDFEFKETIGSGFYSTVHRCIDRVSGEVVAMKLIHAKWTLEKIDLIKKEISILSSLSQANIIRYIGNIECDGRIAIVTEFAPFGDCFNLISTETCLKESIAVKLIYQLSQAVKYLHAANIVHRDIKLENILIFDRTPRSFKIKLADFGLATKVSSLRPETLLCGTPNFLAPESLERRYGLEVDIYAIGVVAYVCLCGYFPFNIFDGEDETDLYRKIRAGKIIFEPEYWSCISKSAKRFIEKLMRKNPHERPSAFQICKLPWIKNSLVFTNCIIK